MENFKSETDYVDSENQTLIEFESSQFKKESSSFENFVKTETKDECNEFFAENDKNIKYQENELLIKKENIVDKQFKYDFDTSKSSFQKEIPGSILKSEIGENSVMKNTNMFSVHPQDFDKIEGNGSIPRNYIEPFKCPVNSSSEKVDLKSQYCNVQIDLKHKNGITAKEDANVELITIQPKSIKKQIKYVCEHCRRGFFHKGNLKRHIYTHIHFKRNIKQHKCILCLYEYADKRNLKQHIDAVHNKIKQYKCVLCPYECAYKQGLKMHIDAVHNKIKQHKCELCPCACTQKQSLKIHINAVHKKIKRHKCVLCSYKCAEKRRLMMHIDAVHNKIKQHKCQLCSYECAQKHKLKIHIDVAHNKIKQKCEFCSSEFTTKSNLKCHIDAVHNKIKQHKCQFCPYETSSKNVLKVHIDAVHNKNKQHKCELCPYETAHKQHLKKHIYAVHNKIKH